ncbi:hypothetical protein BDF21DRAFT_475767 [Thamnidium elegans]|uniref:SH3 domain-containing protein n=1 Tax=Thamnidium elegans TaxID=101142 RepID=A0A8H7W193_9FUNG|nr:hypothetical protein INT48_006706 [Thamnidium elegans]KAI8094038.1 hypothetical protein BDF21DRAFT_475767 [Thamnidium elegans]
MSEILNSPFTILTCTLAIAGWIVTFVGLCASHAFTETVSWWVVGYQFFVVFMACAVFWTNSIRIYYPVILTLIAIGIPYNTFEILMYITAGRASLSAASSGYIILMVTQFSWIFLLGIQHEASVLRSFSDLNHNRFHSRRYSNGKVYQRDASNHIFVNNAIPDLTGPNYPAPLPTQASYPMDNHDHMVSIPMYTSPPNQSTIFLSPHSDYLIPVTAIHNYCANKEDPNELSFSKGEVLHVHEKKGSWWQAKKSTGAIGMIPSNYVTEHTPN